MIPGLGRCPGEGNGYPLQYSGLENPMDCIVHGVTKNRTRMSNFHFHLRGPRCPAASLAHGVTHFLPFSPALRPGCSRLLTLFLVGRITVLEEVPLWGSSSFKILAPNSSYSSRSQPPTVAPCLMLFSLSVMSDTATPWTAACQASLSFTISQGLLKLTFSELVMPSNHLTLCRSLLLLPSVFHQIRVFSSELALPIRWPKYWSFSFCISPAAAAAKLLQSCPTVRPQRQQPTRLPHPWDSPGKNTGVGCHFLIQCMKGKSESEVAQSCPTPSDPRDCSLPGSSVHGICQARVSVLQHQSFH